MNVDKVTPKFYEIMIKILNKYNSWARDKNEKLPRRWFIKGIEAWLGDFEERIKNEEAKEFFNLDLKYQRQVYEETKLIVNTLEVQ